MAAPKRGPWIAGAVVGSLVIGGAGWMLGISPQLQTAATARADAEAARAQNEIHAQRLAVLEEQFAELDTYKAELAGLRTQIPGEDGVRELLVDIETRATAAGLFTVGSSFGLPEYFFPRTPTPPEDPAAVPPAPVAATPAEGTEGAPAPAAETPAPVAPVDPAALPEAAAAAPVVDGLVAIPVEVTVLGTYPATVAFIEQMQADSGRLFLVTSYRITGQKPAPPSGGKPEIKVGDAETVLTGYVYVLPSKADEAAAAADAPTDSTLSGSTDT